MCARVGELTGQLCCCAPATRDRGVERGGAGAQNCEAGGVGSSVFSESLL